MPKLSRELTAIEVGRLRGEGAHAVGGVPGLYMQVMGGSKSWILRFVVGQRRRRMGLGSYPGVTLAQARDKARAAHQVIDQGADPIQTRLAHVGQAEAARARALTFDKACEQFIAAREAEWRNSKHRQQWENSLATYAGPVLGKMDVSEIQQEDVLKVLEPIWRTKTETASRVPRADRAESLTGQRCADIAKATTRHAGAATSTSCCPSQRKSRASNTTPPSTSNTCRTWWQGSPEAKAPAPARCCSRC